MHKPMYHICKAFCGLVPKAVYHILLHIVTNVNCQPSRASLNSPKKCRLHSDKPGLNAGCVSTLHYMVFCWLWTMCIAWEWAISCSRMMASMSLSGYLIVVMVLSFGGFDSNVLQYIM